MTGSTKVIAAVALVAALLGGSIGGALVRSSKSSQPTDTAATTTTTTTDPAQTDLDATDKSLTTGTEQDAKLDTSGTSEDQVAYRDGFEEGYRAASERSSQATTTRYASSGRSSRRTRVVYRNAPSRSVASNGSRQAYYDYSEPRRGRSFWQKHRDKLTVAMGAGGGAIIGGLIGGKRGAGIGALAGGGGSALYTYKLRNRNRRY